MKKVIKDGEVYNVVGIDVRSDTIFLEDNTGVFALLTEEECTRYGFDLKYVGTASFSYILVYPYIVEEDDD